jgi:hypothetical protein
MDVAQRINARGRRLVHRVRKKPGFDEAAGRRGLPGRRPSTRKHTDIRALPSRTCWADALALRNGAASGWGGDSGGGCGSSSHPRRAGTASAGNTAWPTAIPLSSTPALVRRFCATRRGQVSSPCPALWPAPSRLSRRGRAQPHARAVRGLSRYLQRPRRGLADSRHRCRSRVGSVIAGRVQASRRRSRRAANVRDTSFVRTMRSPVRSRSGRQGRRSAHRSSPQDGLPDCDEVPHRQSEMGTRLAPLHPARARVIVRRVDEGDIAAHEPLDR